MAAADDAFLCYMAQNVTSSSPLYLCCYEMSVAVYGLWNECDASFSVKLVKKEIRLTLRIFV